MDIKDCVGELITRGEARNIYQHKYDNSLVIKKMINNKVNGYTENMIEWKMWNTFRYTKYKDSFCPCISISDDGDYLVMVKADCIPWIKFQRVGTLRMDKKLKNEILKMDLPELPAPVVDARPNQPHNWGILNGKRVIVDYGNPKNLKILDDI